MNWELCCLCQTEREELLQSPTQEGFLSLERDVTNFCNLNDSPANVTSVINVPLSQLNDGSGIAATLNAHGACYHKSCRRRCSSSRVKRARDKLDKEAGPSSCIAKQSRRSARAIPLASDVLLCVICNEEDSLASLHKVVTDAVDTKLKSWARATEKFQLLGRLVTAAADAHAGDMYYHRRCYVRTRDAARIAGGDKSDDTAPLTPFDPIACAQIVALIEHSNTTVFKLAELRDMYQQLMRDQGRPCRDRREPHSTRFKEHLIDLLPEWSAYSKATEGRKDVYLSHRVKVVDELHKQHQSQMDQGDALLFMRAAVMMHKFCLRSQKPFDGSFPPDSITAPVSEEMRSFFNVVLQGPRALQGRGTIVGDVDFDARQRIACNISQLLIHNTAGSTHHNVQTVALRHSKERETPFPIYRGLMLHGHGRNKKQISVDYSQGLSVSYDRVMEIKRGVARAVCARFSEDGVVVPSNSRRFVFTTHDVDNLDSTAQGNFCQDEFHGYALSVTNHLSHDNVGVKRASITIDTSDTSTPKLPETYITQQHVELSHSDVYVPRTRRGVVRPVVDVRAAELKEVTWMAHVEASLEEGAPADGGIITWSGFNSLLVGEESVKPPAEIGVYPLFPDKAASASSMKHAMELAMQGTSFLNPGQTSVIGADQPLFAIMKLIQWQYPDTLGETKLVVVMGALHIEDKMHLMAGKLLRDSGWTSLLTQAEVLTSGRSQSALNEHHIKRTRYAHQVTLVALFLLKRRAYAEYCANVMPGPPESFDMWDERSQTMPQFRFWTTIVKIELLMCRFVRSLREGDFSLYVATCDELCGWFHIMDHTNYARWLPVHVRDMVELATLHPAVHAEFVKGHFVVQKTAKKFSLMAKDQAHEQSNKILQMHGGAAGLYEKPESLAMFMLAGPDCARVVAEFESMHDPPPASTAHHEEGRAMQVKFARDVSSFVVTVNQHGNPFLVTGHELVAIDTQLVMDAGVVDSLSNIREAGEEAHATFVRERLEEAAVPLSHTIRRNNKLTFSNRPDRKTKGRRDCGVQRKNTALVTQLFLSLQSRPDADMTEFFHFENQREPPSLADRGDLRSGTKSDILHCLNAPTGRVATAREATVIILDMAAVVHMVRPTRADTFNEYVSLQIVPFINSHVTGTTRRIDAVWDSYPEDNLKRMTQQRRGDGPRTRIGDGNTRLPKSEWNSFLKNENNKKEMFPFISKRLCDSQSENDILLVATHDENAITNRPGYDIAALHPCNHAEADTRIFLHLCHAVADGHKVAYIRTVDSDVVVLAVRFFAELCLSELWIGFASGTRYRDIPVHQLHAALGPSKSVAVALFHSLTGCDTTSQFLGCGKKTAWAAWTAMPELTDSLVALTAQDMLPSNFAIDSPHMQRIERFVVLMYRKSCGAASVNEARHHLFTSGSKSLESIPPTQAALFQHVKRALLQTSFWSQATTTHQNIPDFSEWGWHKDASGAWLPLWTTLSDASVACSILLRCGCAKTCRGRCKCNRAGVRCTSLCKCEGGCLNNEGGDE